jgi:hypothetical protein
MRGKRFEKRMPYLLQANSTVFIVLDGKGYFHLTKHKDLSTAH